MMKISSYTSIKKRVNKFVDVTDVSLTNPVFYMPNDLSVTLVDIKSSSLSDDRVKTKYFSFGKSKDEEKWHGLVESLSIDLTRNFESKLPELEERFEFSFISKIFKDLDQVIAEYKDAQSSFSHIKNISEKSIKNLLYLFPVLCNYSLSVAIDSDTGFINIGVKGNDSSLLNALITNKGEIHYSLVGRSIKIFKISGTAKIKDSRDFKEFRRVMRML